MRSTATSVTNSNSCDADSLAANTSLDSCGDSSVTFSSDEPLSASARGPAKFVTLTDTTFATSTCRMVATSADVTLPAVESTTPNNALALHEAVPPHTPQLSSVLFPQHCPEGDRGEAQHTPSESTTSPLPPHTPHASTAPPAGQQAPRASVRSSPKR